ncbi:MAG: hypothetical protein WC596_04140 [Candidatus Shapirobacteria bacterium]
MTVTQPKKEVKNANRVNPIVAGIAGAVVGGVAVATSMVMSNKKNRDKIKAGLTKVKNQTLDKKAEVKEKLIKEVKKI